MSLYNITSPYLAQDFLITSITSFVLKFYILDLIILLYYAKCSTPSPPCRYHRRRIRRSRFRNLPLFSPKREVTIYEQAKELREIGAGIRIGFNCWTVLGLLGAAGGVKGHLKSEVLHRYDLLRYSHSLFCERLLFEI